MTGNERELLRLLLLAVHEKWVNGKDQEAKDYAREAMRQWHWVQDDTMQIPSDVPPVEEKMHEIKFAEDPPVEEEKGDEDEKEEEAERM